MHMDREVRLAVVVQSSRQLVLKGFSCCICERMSAQSSVDEHSLRLVA